MAVMTARYVARRLVNIQHLNSLASQAVQDMRRDVVKTTVNTLWRRYNQHLKRGETLPFVDWLVAKQHLEATFWHVSASSASLPTRRRWANRYYEFFVRKELTLADDPDNLWVFTDLPAAINAKHNDPDWVVSIEVVARDGIERYHLKPGKSFMFGKTERTKESESELYADDIRPL